MWPRKQTSGPSFLSRAFRYFDSHTLSIPRISTLVDRHGTEETACDCPLCQQRPFPAIADKFVIRRETGIDLTPLYGVFRLHGVFRSSEAFEEGRVYISENDFGRYIKERIGSAADEHNPS